MALKNPDHEILNLIMKHEDIWNSTCVDHTKMRAIENKIRERAYGRVADELMHQNYSSAVAIVAELMTDWDI